MTQITTEQIEAVLFADGLQLDDYFLVDDAPMTWGYLGDAAFPFVTLIEDSALNAASVAYLRKRGTKEYAKIEDVKPPENNSPSAH